LRPELYASSARLAGQCRLAPSGAAAPANSNPDRTAPGMFGPGHGSAPDIAGRQKADPTAAILSTSLLLDHLGYAEASAAVERPIATKRQPPSGARSW